MTFDIPFDQPFDVTRLYEPQVRKPPWKFPCEPLMFLNLVTSLGIQQHV